MNEFRRLVRLRLVHSPPSLHHFSYLCSVLFARAPVLGLCFFVFVMQGLLPPVAVLGCGVS